MDRPKDENLDRQFEDSESYKSFSDKITIKQIVMKQLQKCMDEGSKEMDEGGKRTVIFNGSPVDIIAPNQREILINSIEMLRILVEPIIKKNENVVDEKLKDFKKNLDGLNKLVNTEKDNLKKDLDTKDNKDSYIKDYNRIVSNINNSFRMEKANLYKELLIAISFLLNHINYFEEEGFTGGVEDGRL